MLPLECVDLDHKLGDDDTWEILKEERNRHRKRINQISKLVMNHSPVELWGLEKRGQARLVLYCLSKDQSRAAQGLDVDTWLRSSLAFSTHILAIQKSTGVDAGERKKSGKFDGI